MFRLYTAGKSPTEIARLCAEGTTGVEAFEIPRRTVHEIVTNMAAEAEQAVPTSMFDAENRETVDRFPERIASIIKTELDRIEAKQKRGPLSVKDLDCLDRAAGVSASLAKRINRRQTSPSRGPSSPSRGSSPAAESEGLFEQLAREEAESRRPDDHSSHTHTRQTEPGMCAQTPQGAADQASPGS